MGKDLKSHWDKAYEKSEVNKLGWYEESPEPSLLLINKCKFKKDVFLLNVGVGATTLIDELLKIGYENILANDISSKAIAKLKNRLGDAQSRKVNWIIDDLTKPTKLDKINKVDLWHDRAVLHFFTSEKDQIVYFELLKSLVKKNGFVIISTFNLSSAKMCSGLPIYRYDENMLQEKLGIDFELIEAFNYTYTMPSGDQREYVYTLFKRNS